MAKATVHGGGSNVPDPHRVRRYQLGDDRRLVGSNSKPSENTREQDDNTTETSHRQLAPTTASRLDPPEKATRSNVRSTGGSGRKTGQRQSSKSNKDADFDFDL